MEEKEILRSLETLNRQFITLRESRAYTSGAKIMRLKTELKQIAEKLKDSIGSEGYDAFMDII